MKKRKKIFPLPKSHVQTENWKFLEFEKSPQNHMLELFAVSAEK